MVATPKGEIAIENIHIGMEVYTRNDKGFINGTAKVVDTFGRIAPNYYLITTEFGTVKATEEHLFWMQGQGWVAAKDMKPWYMVAGVEDDVLIKKIKRVDEEVKVYNFEVEGSHSYFVGEGGLWVHNEIVCLNSPLETAWFLIDDLPENIKDNYYAFEKSDGTIIIARHDASKSEKLKFEDNELVPSTNAIPPGNKAKKTPVTGTNLSELDNITVKVGDPPTDHIASESINIASDARHEAVKDLDEAIAAKDNDAIKRARQDKIDASEAMGELAARGWMAKEYPEYEPLYAKLPGNAQSGEFDQLYVHPETGHVIIIEAKGGTSPLGSKLVDNVRYEQGTTAYRDAIIENYKEKINDAENNPSIDEAELNEMEDTLDALIMAKNSNTIDYYVVRQTIDVSGNPSDVKVHKLEDQ